jgi:hypothetical protein
MVKQGRLMMPATNMLEYARKINADYIVLPDYPNEPHEETIKAAKAMAGIYKSAGFGTFFVPQSLEGDLEGYIEAFTWAAASPLIDYIGVSILGVPNAYGVAKDKTQRYLSRQHMVKHLHDRGILDLAAYNGKKIHFLGMLDGPNEIDLCQFEVVIDTWDSSAAVWAAINGVRFDHTPTGLRHGKVEKEVDFLWDIADYDDIGYSELVRDIQHNVGVIESKISRSDYGKPRNRL